MSGRSTCVSNSHLVIEYVFREWSDAPCASFHSRKGCVFLHLRAARTSCTRRICMEESSAIAIRHLSKSYRVAEREAGLRAALRSMVRRTTHEVVAAEEVSFWIPA